MSVPRANTESTEHTIRNTERHAGDPERAIEVRYVLLD